MMVFRSIFTKIFEKMFLRDAEHNELWLGISMVLRDWNDMQRIDSIFVYIVCVYGMNFIVRHQSSFFLSSSIIMYEHYFYFTLSLFMGMVCSATRQNTK